LELMAQWTGAPFLAIGISTPNATSVMDRMVVTRLMRWHSKNLSKV
jgi:hypothetical protein